MSNRFFFPLWVKLHKQDFQEGKYSALVPWKLAVCGFASFASLNCINLGDPAKLSMMFTALAAILTATGILAAITINSIQQVLLNISEPEFSSYLGEEDILDYYMYFIMYFQGVLIISLFIITFWLIALSLDINEKFKYIFISLGVASFLYSLVQAISSNMLVRDLIFYRSKFEERKKIM
jgi:hypothetical protein